MTDELNQEQVVPVVSKETDRAVPQKKKRISSPKRKTEAVRFSSKPAKSEASQSSAKSRRYSTEERTQKLAEIEAHAIQGKTLKAAIKQAGISEQTFYQWRRAAANQLKAATPTKTANIETLSDLVELEAENIRLRSLLADKLRAENAELRKRLGLD